MASRVVNLASCDKRPNNPVMVSLGKAPHSLLRGETRDLARIRNIREGRGLQGVANEIGGECETIEDRESTYEEHIDATL